MTASATPAPLCAALEVALNRYLAQDSGALEALQALHGRTLALHVAPPDWWLVFDFMGQRVRVANAAEGEVEATVHGTPSVYLKLFSEQLQKGGSTLPRGLRVEGDPELLQRFQELLLQVGFDLGEILEPYLGDIAAQRVAEFAGGLLQWTRSSLGSVLRQSSDYLRFESRDLVDREEVERFIEETETVRDRVARLEARIGRLERRRAASSTDRNHFS